MNSFRYIFWALYITPLLGVFVFCLIVVLRSGESASYLGENVDIGTAEVHTVNEEPDMDIDTITDIELQIKPLPIIGDEGFTYQIEKALKLLKENSPREYSLVIKYSTKLNLTMASGANVQLKEVDLSWKSASESVTWCASCLAHEAYHIKLYHEYRNIHGSPVPNNIYSGKGAELKCIRYQILVLKNVNAPQREINWCKSQDGNHFDTNKDGKFTLEDYLDRDW